MEQLRSPDRAERLAALNALVDRAANGDDRAAQALREVVIGYRDHDPEISSRALNRVWVFGDDSMTESLSAMLADDAYGCQLWAAAATAELGIVSAEPLLIALLHHPQGLTREGACEALGRLRAAGAVEPLARVLQDDDADFVRAAASEALADIGGEAAMEHLWSALRARRHQRVGYLAAALARFGPAVFDRLVQAAENPDPGMRFWAARALGSTGDPRALTVLTRMATEDHATTPWGGAVRTAARTALKTWHRAQKRAGEGDRSGR